MKYIPEFDVILCFVFGMIFFFGGIIRFITYWKDVPLKNEMKSELIAMGIICFGLICLSIIFFVRAFLILTT